MSNPIKKIYHGLNEWVVQHLRYQPYIQTILLHKIYLSRDEITTENGTIAEGVDVHQFETFVRYFKERQVQFIDEQDILEGELDPNQQYIYLTFDDGYYNNFNALPVLTKYGIKATFYISTQHIKEQKAYWWDALARALTQQNKYDQMQEMVNQMYQLKTAEQDAHMLQHFGPNALQPNNDIDRPMSKTELKTFASHPQVTIGNHTHQHLNLKLYSDDEIKDNIAAAESFLNEVSTQKIRSISYPHGFVNPHISSLAKDCGYEIGITTIPAKNSHEDLQDPAKRLLLNRTQLSGYFDMESLCRNIHTNHFSLLRPFKSN